MIKNITYENKEAIQNNPDLPKKNMVTDADMNEIKTVVNNNADELNTTKENVENLQEGQGTANTDIANLKSRVSTLETDNTKNKSDIENLQNDNETNQSNIGELRQKTEQIEENISDIQQEQETQNTEIKNLQQEVQELEQDVKANALEEETEQAKSLYITDASGARGSLKVLGNDEQDGEPSLNSSVPIKCLGSNINLYPGWEKNTISSETGEPEIDPNYIRSVDFISVLPNKNYTIKAYNIEEFGDLNTAVRMYDINKNYLSSKWIGIIINKSITFTLTNADVRYIKIVCSNNNTVTNTAKVDIKLEEGEIATSYSPYGQGSTEIKQYNKNLAESIEIFSTSGQYGTMCIAGYTIKKGEKYTISFDTPNSGTDCYLQDSREIKLSYDGGYYYTNLDGTRKSIVVTATETGYFKSTKGIILKRTNDSKKTGLISNFMIEKWNGNDKASDYEETKKNIFNIDIQQEMLKGDYFDLETKEEVHCNGKAILNGTEAWTKSGTASTEDFPMFYTNRGNIVSSGEVKSNALKYVKDYQTQDTYVTSVGEAINIRIATEIIGGNTVELFKTFLQNRYNEGKAIEVYYKRSTPARIPLTADQIEVLEKLSKLRYYEGVNNILTTEDIALLQAKYSVNIQSKINSLINAKISELNQPELLNK